MTGMKSGVGSALVPTLGAIGDAPITEPSALRQRNNRVEWKPYRRATSDSVAPPTSISTMIAFACCLPQLRRVVATTS